MAAQSQVIAYVALGAAGTACACLLYLGILAASASRNRHHDSSPFDRGVQ